VKKCAKRAVSAEDGIYLALDLKKRLKEALHAASNGSFLITRRDIIINLLLGLHRLPIAQIILRIFFLAVSLVLLKKSYPKFIGGKHNQRPNVSKYVRSV